MNEKIICSFKKKTQFRSEFIVHLQDIKTREPTKIAGSGLVVLTANACMVCCLNRLLEQLKEKTKY